MSDEARMNLRELTATLVHAAGKDAPYERVEDVLKEWMGEKKRWRATVYMLYDQCAIVSAYYPLELLDDEVGKLRVLGEDGSVCAVFQNGQWLYARVDFIGEEE